MPVTPPTAPPFWNRTDELARLRASAGRGSFGFVTGRRRIGKTALLEKACRDLDGFYHQAVEGTAQQQLMHLAEEMAPRWPLFREVAPRGWIEFFRLLSREKLPRLFVLDEFPYLVQGDPSLPSVLQKWLDHDLPKHRTLFLVSGSSQAMLHTHLLNQTKPLFGRASLKLDLPPLSFGWFCRALGLDPADSESFLRFSLVGGVPHYWKIMPPGVSCAAQAEDLFFRPSALLAMEPTHWLREEGVAGTLPKAMLDMIGRGVAKPGELAARLSVPHGNLSRPLALLLDLGFIDRELPFGETVRSTKKALYSIQDPALRFHYGTFLPLRGRWPSMTDTARRDALERHASLQWEIQCRKRYPGSSRYWEGSVELDLVAPLEGGHRHLVAESKWISASRERKRALADDLRSRFNRTSLSRKLKKVEFAVFTKEDLPKFR